MPNHRELFEDLTSPTWGTRNGKIFVESKEDLRKRLGRSPDKGDAVVHANWVRKRPVQEIRPEKPLRVCDPEVLTYEADQARRVRSGPVRDDEFNPLIQWVI